MKEVEIDVTWMIAKELKKLGYKHSDILEMLDRPIIVGLGVLEDTYGVPFISKEYVYRG